MAARDYQLVLGEITTGLFACPDCGAVVWVSLRGEHDTWHALSGDQEQQVAESLDEHAEQIARLQGQVSDVESSVYRLSDDVRDVGYRADDARRAADDAARNTSRGW